VKSGLNFQERSRLGQTFPHFRRGRKTTQELAAQEASQSMITAPHEHAWLAISSCFRVVFNRSLPEMAPIPKP
jgi:hypothetical protein